MISVLQEVCLTFLSSCFFSSHLPQCDETQFPRPLEDVIWPCWSSLLPIHPLAATLLQEARSPCPCFYATQGGGSRPRSPPGDTLSVLNKLILENNEFLKEHKIFFCVYHKPVYKVNREWSVIWVI